jgi:hypothetical protein
MMGKNKTISKKKEEKWKKKIPIWKNYNANLNNVYDIEQKANDSEKKKNTQFKNHAKRK